MITRVMQACFEIHVYGSSDWNDYQTHLTPLSLLASLPALAFRTSAARRSPPILSRPPSAPLARFLKPRPVQAKE